MKNHSVAIRKLHTKDALRRAVEHWADILNVRPSGIYVLRMKKKWASCSTRKRICFNDQLLEKPARFQHEVILHEVLHLQIPNHGKLFKSMFNTYLPKT